MKVEVVVNTGAGPDARSNLQRELEEMFSSRGADATVHVAQSGDEVDEFARRAASGNAAIVVAGGGDGTINSVASALVASSKPAADGNTTPGSTVKTLGVLPLGTLNHFAKDMNIPLDLAEAVETITDGKTVRIDVGEFNGRMFLNNSSLGLYPHIIRERDKQQRLGSGKWPAYMWAAFSVLRRYPFLDIRVHAEGDALTTRTPFLFVGNNEYEMETLNVGARKRLNAGVLSLYMTHRTGRLGLVRLALRALFGGLNQEKDFLALTTDELWIETRKRRLRVALDGEITVMQPPLHYRIRKQALAVRVPLKESSETKAPTSRRTPKELMHSY